MPHAPVSIADIVEQAQTHAKHPGRPPRTRGPAFWQWYARYLACEAWAARREVVLARDHHTCRCGAPASEVHHLRYSRVGCEPLVDLVAVCTECHDRLHRRAA